MISPHPRRAHLQEGPIPLSQPCWSLRNWRDSPWPSTNLSVAEGLTCFLLVLTVFTVSLLTCWLSSCLFCLPLTGTGRRMPTSHPLCCAMVGVILVVWPLCVQSFWFYETGNRSILYLSFPVGNHQRSESLWALGGPVSSLYLRYFILSASLPVYQYEQREQESKDKTVIAVTVVAETAEGKGTQEECNR